MKYRRKKKKKIAATKKTKMPPNIRTVFQGNAAIGTVDIPSVPIPIVPGAPIGLVAGIMKADSANNKWSIKV